MCDKKAFTLVELLVVVAIVALLLAVLVPTFHAVKERARIVVCQANLKALTQAWVTYTSDNQGYMPDAFPGGSGGTRNWIGGANNAEPAKKGSLWQYTQDEKLYKCQSNLDHWKYTQYSVNPPPWSYSVNNYLAGAGWGYDVIEKYSQIVNAMGTFVFMEEEDPRGSNMGSWVMRLTGDSWVDYPATWHLGGATLSFADGRAEYWKWQDPRTLAITSFYESHPGSVDIHRMQRVSQPLKRTDIHY